MQTAIRLLMCALLQSRKREEWVSGRIHSLLIAAAVVCGGVMGFCIHEWLPLATALAVFAVGITVAVCDLLCRIIPNPTVLAIFAVKLLLIALALLKVPGAPALGFSLLWAE